MNFLWHRAWWPWSLRAQVRDLKERNKLVEDRATELVMECARLRREVAAQRSV